MGGWTREKTPVSLSDLQRDRRTKSGGEVDPLGTRKTLDTASLPVGEIRPRYNHIRDVTTMSPDGRGVSPSRLPMTSACAEVRAQMFVVTSVPRVGWGPLFLRYEFTDGNLDERH